MQDAFSYLVNTEYYRREHMCSLAESYHHVFFSESAVNRFVRREFEREECSGDEARFLFYCFLISQICADAAVPQQAWLDTLGFLGEAGYPAPCTPVPPPRAGAGR